MTKRVPLTIVGAGRLALGLFATGFVAFASLALGEGPAAAQEQGYWKFEGGLPAEVKPVVSTRDVGWGDTAQEEADGRIRDTDYGPKVAIVTDTVYSQPPAVLIPGQKVKFWIAISIVKNTFNGLNFGAEVNYYYYVSKDPGAQTAIAATGMRSGEGAGVSSHQDSGILTVPEPSPNAQARAEQSLWLRVAVNDPLYRKYYKYAWVGGPAPANAQRGDFDAGLPKTSDSASNTGANTGANTGPNIGPDNGANNSPPAVVKPCPDTAAAQTELQACRITANAGATVQVPVYLNKASDLANLNFDLLYDGAVAKAAGKAMKGSLLGSQALFESNLSQVGAAHIGFAGTTGVTGSGVIAYVPFTIVGAPGSHTSLELKDTAANTSTSGRPAIALAAGEIVVAGAAPPPPNPPPPGPPPSNPPPANPPPEKTFTALDALKALQMSVGLLAPDMAYDLDKNGQITSNDARLILSRVVGR
jgi:hypothetical protein